MSTRAHFWFRIAAISAIMAAQFGPRLWASASGTPGRVVASQGVTAAATIP